MSLPNLRGINVYDLLGVDPHERLSLSTLANRARRIAALLHPDNLARNGVNPDSLPYNAIQANALVDLFAGRTTTGPVEAFYRCPNDLPSRWSIISADKVRSVIDPELSHRPGNSQADVAPSHWLITTAGTVQRIHGPTLSQCPQLAHDLQTPGSGGNSQGQPSGGSSRSPQSRRGSHFRSTERESQNARAGHDRCSPQAERVSQHRRPATTGRNTQVESGGESHADTPWNIFLHINRSVARGVHIGY